MQITSKQYADYFVIALEIGLSIKEEIINWADNLILKSFKPPMWMIDLSTSQKKSILDTISLLKEVEGHQNLNISFRLAVAKISILYPSIDMSNIEMLFDLYAWYLEHEEVDRDIPIIDSYTLMMIEELYITIGEINKDDYKNFITIGKGYIQYLPNNIHDI